LSEINRMIKEKLQGEQIRAEWFLDFLLIFIFIINMIFLFHFISFHFILFHFYHNEAEWYK
jgi:hypothetical protein